MPKTSGGPASQVVEGFVSKADGDKADSDKATLESLLESIGSRAFGPLLLIPGVLALAPTGAIPGMSILTGSIIFLVAVQLLLGRKYPWLPKRALSFELEAEKVKQVGEKLRPHAKRVDRVLRKRMTILLDPPFLQIIALACMAMAVMMYPLALLPFAVAAPALAVTVLALGIMAHDGLVVAVGLACTLGACSLAAWLLL